MKVIKDKSAKQAANWSALKLRLANLDPASLVGLLHELYAASKTTRLSCMPALTWATTFSNPTRPASSVGCHRMCFEARTSRCPKRRRPMWPLP